MTRANQRLISQALTVVGVFIPMVIASGGPLGLTEVHLTILGLLVSFCLIVQGQLEPTGFIRNKNAPVSQERRTDPAVIADKIDAATDILDTVVPPAPPPGAPHG